MRVILVVPTDLPEEEQIIVDRLLRLHRIAIYDTIEFAGPDYLADEIAAEAIHAYLKDAKPEEDLFIIGAEGVGNDWTAFEANTFAIMSQIGEDNAPIARFYWINRFLNSVSVLGIFDVE